MARGRDETGRGGFVLWFPYLLVSTVGTGIVFRHWVEGVAVPLPIVAYAFPVAFLLALSSRPVFRMNVGYLVVHAVAAAALVVLFIWSCSVWSPGLCSRGTSLRYGRFAAARSWPSSSSTMRLMCR